MRWKRNMAQMLKWCTVSSVTLCNPHHSVFVHPTWKVRQPTLKRCKLWLQFFSIDSMLCFFWEITQTERDGWMDGEKPHHIITPQALMETCRLLGNRSTHSLRLPWEPGYMASWMDTDVFASHRFERSRIDMSAWPKGKAGREETFPACILQHLGEAKCTTSISSVPVSTEERKGVMK